VRAVFTLITLIFIVCVAFTVTSFTEIPLRVLERQKQMGEGSQRGVEGKVNG
jgi:solute carrier family 45 protein 1/2/4